MIRHPATQKFNSIQILRAFAAWMVVYHHFIAMYFSWKTDNIIGKFFGIYGSFGVDVFFVISGFVMYIIATGRKQTARSFMIGRIFRIVPAYWLYTLTIPVFLFFFPTTFAFSTYNFESLACSLFFVPTENPSGIGIIPLLTVGWTLNFEMFFYATLAICLLINKRFAIPLCFVVILILPLVYPKNVAYSSVASNPLLFEFIQGFLIAFLATNEHTTRFLSRYRALAVALTAVIVAVFVFMLHKHYPFVKEPLAGWIVLLAVLSEPYVNTSFAIVRNLVRLGDESFSTYLVHIIVIGIFLHFTGNDLSRTGQLAILAGISIVVWLASMVSYRNVEQSRRLAGMHRMLFIPIRVGGHGS